MEANQQALDIELMNAYVAVENYRAQDALNFLGKLEFSKLSSDLKPVYYSISGQANVLLKNFEAGITELQEALDLLEHDPKATYLQIERVRNWIGTAYYDRSDVNQALKQHLQCLQAVINRRVVDARFRLKLYLNLGNDFLMLGNWKRALEFYRQALPLAVKGEDREDLGGLYWAIGLAYRGKHNLARAKLYLEKSTRQFKDIGELKQSARARNLLGLVMIERKEFELAEETLKEAFSLADSFKDTEKDLVALTSASANLALLYKQQKKWAQAEEWGVASLNYATELGNDMLQLSQSQAQLAEIKLALGKKDETIELFNQAVTNIERTQLASITRQIYFRYGSSLKQMGRMKEAVDIMSKSVPQDWF